MPGSDAKTAVRRGGECLMFSLVLATPPKPPYIDYSGAARVA